MMSKGHPNTDDGDDASFAIAADDRTDSRADSAGEATAGAKREASDDDDDDVCVCHA